MKIIFLGTNGWYTTQTGNTPCILIDSKDYYIVLDAGNGIHKLDKYITEEKPLYLFLSHFHGDHTSGLHILPKFKFNQTLNIVVRKGGTKTLETLVESPFSKPLRKLSIKTKILELPDNKNDIPFSFDYFDMFHIDPNLGYRFYLDDKIVAYSGDSGICSNSIPLAKDTDLLIHECTNKSGETSGKWGHVNPEELRKLVKDANVKKLAMTHFDSNNYQSLEERIKSEEIVRKEFPNAFAATDDQIIEL